MLKRIRETFDGKEIRTWVYIALVFVVAAVIWAGYFTYRYYAGHREAQVAGIVYYNETPLANVHIFIGDEEVATDEDGAFTLSPLSFGRHAITITRDRFLPYRDTFFVWRKNVALKQIKLLRDPAYAASFTGTILDRFDKTPLEGAVVKLGESSGITDEDGTFIFEDQESGEHLLTISAIGFEDFEQKVIVGSSTQEATYELTPYGRISFTSTRAGQKNVYAVHYDGQGLVNMTPYVGDSWSGMFSANGERLVFYSTLAGEVTPYGKSIPHLYAVDKDGGNLQRITEKVFPEEGFVVTRDGQRVIFLARETSDTDPEIYAAGLGTNKEWRQLTNNDISETNLDISPDGTKILYSAFVDGSRDVYVVDLATYSIERITDNQDYERFIAFSPDGRYILYVSEGFDFNSRIYVYNMLTKTTSSIYKTSLAIRNVVWSGDSTQILFTSARDSNNNIFAIDRSGGKELKLTELSADYRHIIWPSINKILSFIIHTDTGDSLAVMDLTSRAIIELEQVTDDVLSWAEK